MNRILVTGGNGFLGSHVVERLQAVPGSFVFAPRSTEFDHLVPDDVEMLLEVSRPHVVIHLAGKVGGIGANRLHPGSFFRDNILMGIQLIEACRTSPAAKDLRTFVQLGTVCAYPKFTPVPFREDDLWNGYPEETKRPLRHRQEGAPRHAPGLPAGVRLPGRLPLPARRPPPHPRLVRRFPVTAERESAGGPRGPLGWMSS